MFYFKNINLELIKEYKEFFINNDYVHIKNILTDDAKLFLTNNIQFDIETANDKIQFGRNHGINMINNEFSTNYQNETLEFIRSVIGSEYYKTCAFPIEYIKGSEVIPHLDLIINEVSATLCYDTNGDYPIFISSIFMDNNYNNRYTEFNIDSIHEENIIKIDLKCGDIAIFNGRNHLHWREKMNSDISYKAILSHYSKTIPNSLEWNEKTSETVPLKNSINMYYK